LARHLAALDHCAKGFICAVIAAEKSEAGIQTRSLELFGQMLDLIKTK